MGKYAGTSDGRIRLFRKMMERGGMNAGSLKSYVKYGDRLAYSSPLAMVSQFDTVPEKGVAMDLYSLTRSGADVPDYNKILKAPDKRDIWVEFPEELVNCLKAFYRPKVPGQGEVICYIDGDSFYVRDRRDDTRLTYTNLKIQRPTRFGLNFLSLSLLAPKRIYFAEGRSSIPIRVKGSYDPVVDSFRHVIMMAREVDSDES